MTNKDMDDSQEWAITGMDCAACAVERLPGVSDVNVAVMAEKLTLKLEPGTTPRDKIEAAVVKLGYGIGQTGPSKPKTFALQGAVAVDHASHDHAGQDHAPAAPHMDDPSSHGATGHHHDVPADNGRAWFQTAKGRLVIGTGLLLASAWVVRLMASPEIANWAFIVACLIGVAPVAKRAFAALLSGSPFTIELLMSIAAIGALFIGAAEEAALVVFLFAVGEVLEGVAANKARSSIKALAKLVPKTARLEENGTTRDVPAATLRVGQRVLVRPGDRIPADGEIAEGTSGIDESPVTGESVPRTKGPGDPVFAGSINAEAALRITVTKTAEDNTIARIVKLVEEAETARAPTERFIDRFSRIYMPAIVGVALLVAFVPTLAFGQDWSIWIYRALALLLIGCPCALVISVPAAIASALSSGARRGLLMKGGAVIEAAARVTRVAFDKTGTLTHGKPTVTDIVPLGSATEAQVLEVAAGVEGGSSHPLAAAILERAEAGSVAALPAREAKVIIGKGVEAIVGGDAKAWVASPKFAAQAGALEGPGLRRATQLEDEGKTVVVVYREREAFGLIALRDEPRADAADAMRQLRSLGITPVVLTGDNPRTAAAIATAMGLEFRAEMMPEC
jgi:Zn2+/Cd2+-exporting ATPase